MPPIDGVKIELGGRARRLRYDTLALQLLEEETGQDFIYMLAKCPTSVSATMNLLWAGLLHAEPELRPHDVAKMVPVLQIKELREAVLAAVRRATGQADEPEPEGTHEGNAEAAD